MTNPVFTAIVLAADRGAADPVARAAGQTCKALAPLGGQAMILRTLSALRDARSVDDIVIVGPREKLLQGAPAIEPDNDAERPRWATPAPSPVASVLAVAEQLPPEQPLLVITADHALPDSRMIDAFCHQALAGQCDTVVAVVAHEKVRAAYPDFRKTVLKFSDGGWCGCNLFAFLSPAGRLAARYWRRLETRRKHPLWLMGSIGWLPVFRYLTGRLSLDDALRRLSSLTGARIGAVRLPWPEAAIDVDSVEDWQLARQLVETRSHRPGEQQG